MGLIKLLKWYKKNIVKSHEKIPYKENTDCHEVYSDPIMAFDIHCLSTYMVHSDELVLLQLYGLLGGIYDCVGQSDENIKNLKKEVANDNPN